MTRKQAFLAAVSGGTPDVVPVAPLIHHRYAQERLGRSDWRAVFEVHQQLGSCHHRGPLGLGLPSRLPEGVGSQMREVSRDLSGRTTSEWVINTPSRRLVGTQVRGMIPHDPLVGKTTDYPVKTEADWRAYLEYSQLVAEGLGPPAFTMIQEAVAVMGEDGMPSVGLGPAYTALASVRGMEGFMLDLLDYPDLMRELFAVQRQITNAAVQAFVDSPTPVAWLDICWASGSGLGPTLFEQWALPDVVEAMAVVRGHPGKYLGLYTLGKIGKLMPMLADAGVAFVSTFEPNEGDMTLAEAKRRFGGRMAIFGNFDCNVLAFGTTADAVREARRCLNEGMEGGGYVMVTADEVPADAKWDNLRAMVDTVHEYGRY
jgi:uroporphyrinogen-III decarboxylase